MLSCAEQFIECLASDPSTIAICWFSKGLISVEILDKTDELDEIKKKKARRLYREAVKLVEQKPDKYQTIIESFEGKELFSDLKELLDKKYGKKQFDSVTDLLIMMCVLSMHVHTSLSLCTIIYSYLSDDPEEERMDVTPAPLNLETADSMDEMNGVVRSDSLATTSDCSSPPSSPMSLSSASSPSSSLTGFTNKRRERGNDVNIISQSNILL